MRPIYEHDAEYHWIVESDGEGSSRIVAKDVLPSFGEWVEQQSRPSVREAAEAHGIPVKAHDLPPDIVHPAPFAADWDDPAMDVYNEL